MSIRGPAKRPCGSCPYRQDVPSGVWDCQEYAKLPRYDAPTPEQPPAVFACHQRDGRVCAGWAGTHDGPNLLSLRLALLTGSLTPEVFESVCRYETDVSLFDSGAAAAAHGLAEVTEPGERAARTVRKLIVRRSRIP